MVSTNPGEDEALCIIALNILCGNIKPDQWKGFRRVDEDDEALLNVSQAIRKNGFGKLEVTYVRGQLDTVYKTDVLKRKDLLGQ